MNAVLNGQVDGYLCFETRANFFANHEYSGRVSVYATKLKAHLYALAMPRQSPLRRPINIAVLRLMNDSVWESLLNRYGLEEASNEVGQPSSKERR
jgi:ABC-type amino acid transport substrate-binding protein